MISHHTSKAPLNHNILDTKGNKKKQGDTGTTGMANHWRKAQIINCTKSCRLSGYQMESPYIIIFSGLVFRVLFWRKCKALAFPWQFCFEQPKLARKLVWHASLGEDGMGVSWVSSGRNRRSISPELGTILVEIEAPPTSLDVSVRCHEWSAAIFLQAKVCPWKFFVTALLASLKSHQRRRNTTTGSQVNRSLAANPEVG